MFFPTTITCVFDSWQKCDTHREGAGGNPGVACRAARKQEGGFMCYRIAPLSMRQAEDIARQLEVSGTARVPAHGDGRVGDAFPGSAVPLFIPNASGQLEARELTWGFVNPRPTARGRGLVYNTRIESARAGLRTGGGMWVDAIRQGRCLVAVHAFWEWWTRPSPEATYIGSDGKSHRRCVRFSLAGYPVFLMACVHMGERFSIVTTEPNAYVSPTHSRMPLVLGPGESGIWLGPDWEQLADRSAVPLHAEVEG